MSIRRNVLAYLSEQKRDFIKAFQQPAAYPVGVQHPAQSSRSHPVASWSWDRGASGQNAFIRTVEASHKEYWARLGFGGYRDGFLSFLEREQGVAKSNIPSQLHADHLLNSGFALRRGLMYVRLALVEGEINVGYGRKIEKNLTRSEAQNKSQYLFDYIVLMKALNIEPPRDPEDFRRRREEIASRIVSEGAEKRELVLEGLDGTFKLWDVLT
jgi:hypothetical protein